MARAARADALRRVGGRRATRGAFRPTLLASLLALAGIAFFSALGVWQLQRADAKRELARVFERRFDAAPVRLGVEPTTEPESLRHRRARAAGTFDTDHQFLLDNRTRRGVAGYHVLTPLRLGAPGAGARSGTGAIAGVIVNRGWVPVGKSRAELPALPAPSGAVELTGRVTIPSSDPLLLGPAGYETEGWPRVVQAIDLGAMQRLLGYRLLPYTLRLAEGEPAGFVREWRPYYGIGPQRHQAYAVQWFALAATVLAVYAVLGRRRGRPRAERGAHGGSG